MTASPPFKVPRPEDFHDRGNAQWRQQSLQFLKASTPELRELVNKALECNPLLEEIAPPAPVTAEAVADVTVARDGSEFTIRMNTGHIPRVRIRQVLAGSVESAGQTREARRLRARQVAAARFIVQCLRRRQETIYKVACEIVRQQQDFFEHGVAALRPLIMRDIAHALDMHQTTISRAVRHKFMQTPHGLVEFRYFFTAGYSTPDGQSVSSTCVKELLARYIREEDPTHPLSDSKLAQRLNFGGLPVARRTVVKYRMELGIPSSHLRRKTSDD